MPSTGRPIYTLSLKKRVTFQFITPLSPGQILYSFYAIVHRNEYSTEEKQEVSFHPES